MRYDDLPDWAQNVSRETFSKLESYVALLQKWNAKINLIGPTTESEIWARHILDSLQLYDLLPASIKNLADFGSGAGLPGIVLAITRPELCITLVEQDQRKAAFLIEAKRVLQLEMLDVQAINIKNLEGIFDVISARALKALDELFSLALPHLGVNSICLFPKGENFATEIAVAEEKFGFDCQLFPSKTHDRSCIVSISKLHRKG